MSYTLKMRLWRGDQSGGDLQDFDVEVETGEVVLDAIHRVQATQAGDPPSGGTARPASAARAAPR
jgi:succinate dehydrogenase / fumarate reductase iron-sulfur subunit